MAQTSIIAEARVLAGHHMEPEAAALALDALIGESLDLVDALLPQVDTAAARARRELPLRGAG